MLEKHLQELGLSDKEATVYIALLQVDNDSVLALSRKTKINRTTIYPVLESLAKKGLISEVKIDNKARYEAQPPERLETYVERQKLLLEESSKRLQSDIVPQLKGIQREQGERPVVKYFEGREGLVTGANDFFSSLSVDSIYHSIYSRDLVQKWLSKEEREVFVNITTQKNIKLKVVYTDTTNLPFNPNNNNLRIKLDENKYPISCDITIAEDKVKISILGEKLSGISIMSKDVAQTLRSLLEYTFDLEREIKKLKIQS